MPSCPEKLAPQQYAALLVVTPHVRLDPALTAAKLIPPVTATGAVKLSIAVSAPSSPVLLRPQQYAEPVTVRLHVWRLPALTVTKLIAEGPVTVTAAVPLCASLVAVIVTGPPTATPVTSPVDETVATAALPVVQVTTRPVSTFLAASLVVAASCTVAPALTVAVAGLTVTDATGADGAVDPPPPPQAASTSAVTPPCRRLDTFSAGFLST